MTLKSGIRFLAEGGLNLFSVLDCATLPETTTQMMIGSGVPLADYRRLVLIGHGGRRLWQALQTWEVKTDHPFDDYSQALTQQFIQDYLDDSPTLWLYPDTDYQTPLQQLGAAANWSHPSPLGSSISPIYGVWFAYRAAFLTQADLPLIHQKPAPSPCNSCVEKPCMTTCPVNAVGIEMFDIDACGHHRISPNSPCADRCLARMACPFFPEHQYTLEQIQHHYGHSWPTLRAWYGGGGQGASKRPSTTFGLS